MTRSSAREIAMHIIFSLGFDDRSAQEVLDAELNRERFQELAEELPLYEQFPNEKQERYIRELVQGVFSHGPELDDCISRYSVGWAMYEVLYMPDIPNAAAINEAVEIAKKYEPVEVVSFVNGILGTFVRTEFEDTPPKPEKTADPSKQEEA